MSNTYSRRRPATQVEEQAQRHAAATIALHEQLALLRSLKEAQAERHAAERLMYRPEPTAAPTPVAAAPESPLAQTVARLRARLAAAEAEAGAVAAHHRTLQEEGERQQARWAAAKEAEITALHEELDQLRLETVTARAAVAGSGDAHDPAGLAQGTRSPSPSALERALGIDGGDGIVGSPLLPETTLALSPLAGDGHGSEQAVVEAERTLAATHKDLTTIQRDLARATEALAEKQALLCKPTGRRHVLGLCTLSGRRFLIPSNHIPFHSPSHSSLPSSPNCSSNIQHPQRAQTCRPLLLRSAPRNW